MDTGNMPGKDMQPVKRLLLDSKRTLCNCDDCDVVEIEGQLSD